MSALSLCILFGTRKWSMIFQPTFQIRSHKCGSNSMVGAPYPHPQHIMFVNHLVYIRMDVGIIPYGMRASTTAWWYHLTPNNDPWFQLTFQIWSHKCGGNSMAGASYPHLQHIMFDNHTTTSRPPPQHSVRGWVSKGRGTCKRGWIHHITRRGLLGSSMTIGSSLTMTVSSGSRQDNGHQERGWGWWFWIWDMARHLFCYITQHKNILWHK